MILVLVLNVFDMAGQARYAVVADTVTNLPLSNASVFDRHGNVIGMCNSDGRMPYVAASDFPITVRYLGYKEKVVAGASSDTIFLQECQMELPEVVVESRRQKVMHMLAYVREYSTLSTYTDTVFLFREKMVDYMLPHDKKTNFKGWTRPRIIKAKSYYRFTDANGLDSVSDRCRHHFSWSDWVGCPPATKIPPALRAVECGTDTLYGRYSRSEVWFKGDDRVTADVNVLADSINRRWVPGLSGYFRGDLDFENFRVRFNYGNVVADSVSSVELTGYSFNIESNGRGHEMFMFNHIDEPFFVSTYAEVYMVDKEYITVKEARKWERHRFDADEIEIFEPVDAPDLQPAIRELVERVENVDDDGVRLALAVDPNIGSGKRTNHNFRFGNRVLLLLKDITGISMIKARKNIDRNWNELKKKRIRSRNRPSEEK